MVKRLLLTTLIFIVNCLLITACKAPDQPVSPVTCKIRSDTTKIISTTQASKETITLDGNVYSLVNQIVDLYEYDPQERLTVEIDLYNGRILTYKYRYNSDSLYVIAQNSALIIPDIPSSGITNFNYLLTNQGFINDPSIYQRDTEGHVIEYLSAPSSTTYTFNNGNAITGTRVTLAATTKTVATLGFEYDLSKLSLPTIYQYQGKPSKNLLVKYTINEVVSALATGRVEKTNNYTYTYTYSYDSEGRVKRQLIKSEGRSATGIVYLDYTVHDFTYTCH